VNANGTRPPTPNVGQIVLLRDAAGFLRRWQVIAERHEDGTVWVGLRPA
jgi:hypothetical protein